MTTPEVSVILPTIRPHLLRRSLGSIPMGAYGISYEAIVVADFPPFEDLIDTISQWWVTWVIRGRRGVVDAANAGFRVAQGRYVALFNDESTYDEGALRKVHAEAERQPRRLLSPEHLPAFNFSYYGRQFVPFVFAARYLLDFLGGGALLDPAYQAFYADPDLSLRAQREGIPVAEVKGATLRHHNEHDAAHHASVSRYLEQDRATFRARWDHLGEFKDP